MLLFFWDIKFISAKVRIQPAHNIKDVKSLLNNVKANILVADKAYDAGWLHEFCFWRKIEAHIPIKGQIGRHKKGGWRKKAVEFFRKKTYNRRSTVEASIRSLKRKFGSSVNSKYVTTIKSEIYGRILTITYLADLELFRTEPLFPKYL